MLSAVPAFADAPAATIADATRGLQSLPGFLDVWRDADKGRVLLSVSALNQPFLLLTSLPYALGSNDVGLDRAQAGEMRMFLRARIVALRGQLAARRQGQFVPLIFTRQLHRTQNPQHIARMQDKYKETSLGGLAIHVITVNHAAC